MATRKKATTKKTAKTKPKKSAKKSAKAKTKPKATAKDKAEAKVAIASMKKAGRVADSPRSSDVASRGRRHK